jgi:hypothetical protein
MDDYTITIEEIASWFSSKMRALEIAGVILAGIQERRGTSKPSAFADYDTDLGIGRIVVWVSGEIDFEVLRRSDGEGVLLRHETEPSLESAFNTFLASMVHPHSPISKRDATQNE